MSTTTWQQIQSQAQIKVGPLRATVDSLNPALGVHQIQLQGEPIAGSLFSAVVAELKEVPRPLSTDGMESFVRDKDFVANYPQTESQPFTMHVYWRVERCETDLVVFDTIISLQTSLLECFPVATLTTQLPAGEAWELSSDSAKVQRINGNTSSDQFAGVLIKSVTSGWNYLEATYPDDLGTWSVETNSEMKIRRELGGEFQEKGVIRRLRVRGAFYTAKDQIETAARLLEEFAAAPPPLTT